MISDFTRLQLDELPDLGARPLIICDVDEVVVHFTKAFESYLESHDLYLDPASFALHGNIKSRTDHTPVTAERIALMVDDFFDGFTEDLAAIDGAVDALQTLSGSANVVLLTNLPHHARDKRIANMRKHGLEFPCITNSGPKGPAISRLTRERRLPTVFIDDSPNFISSSYEHAPDVHLVHFLQDERFARNHQPFPFVSLTTGTWDEALPHIQGLIT